MKKRLFISLVLLLLTLSMFSADALAKPAYCEKALNDCLAQCDKVFFWPLNEACRAGCAIGYLNCGNS